jgi:hypothetical protein
MVLLMFVPRYSRSGSGGQVAVVIVVVTNCKYKGPSWIVGVTHNRRQREQRCRQRQPRQRQRYVKFVVKVWFFLFPMLELTLLVLIFRTHNSRAEFQDQQRTRRAAAAFTTPPKTRIQKRRMSHTEPKLPCLRFKGDPQDHAPVITKTQKRCLYCSYQFLLSKKEGVEPLPKISRPKKMCIACGDHLCHTHFEVFHDKEL